MIVGGGAIGYHLAKMGKRDVVVLEKSGLTHGPTWHAAGLIGQLRGKRNPTRMLQYCVERFDRLEAETGQATDWSKIGSPRPRRAGRRSSAWSSFSRMVDYRAMCDLLWTLQGLVQLANDNPIDDYGAYSVNDSSDARH